MFLLVCLACGFGSDVSNQSMAEEKIPEYQSIATLPPPPPPPPPLRKSKKQEIERLEQSLVETRYKLDCMASILSDEVISAECESYIQECNDY